MPHRQRPFIRTPRGSGAATLAALCLCILASASFGAETPPAEAVKPEAKTATPTSVEIRNVATSWDNLSELFMGGGLATPFSEGSVFVIRGELINRSDKPIHHVLIRYELLGAGGEVVRDLEGYNRLAEAMRPDESGKVDATAVKPIAARGNDTFRMVFFGDETPRFASHRVRVVEVFDKVDPVRGQAEDALDSAGETSPVDSAAEAATRGRREPTPDFAAMLAEHGHPLLRRGQPSTLQVNVGKVCNQACHHCHVDAGPKRTEAMSGTIAARVLELLEASPEIALLDITGGAPELNDHFGSLVEGARAMGRRVMVRCNLTVIFEDGMGWLPGFYRINKVELVCSLPCYTGENVDRQRGRGVFDKSIEALRLLGRMGYATPGSDLKLDLVYNPVGAFLPPEQAALEAKYREELDRLFGIRFGRLLTITNMPIKRFAEMLVRSGEYERYMSLLVQHFNAATVPGLMCRDMLSVGYRGALYDCDFNQMLEMPLLRGGQPQTLWTIERASDLAETGIATGSHCFGCTAGAGSSCAGALA